MGTRTLPDISLAFAGSVLPDLPEFEGPAFSRAGVRFQSELLKSIAGAGIRPNLVLSYEHVPAFPRSKRIWLRGRSVELTRGISVRLMSFLNVVPFKQLTIGLAMALRLLQWRWGTRHQEHHVVYCFNLSVPPGIIMYMAARLIGAKIVASLNDIHVPGEIVPSRFIFYLDYWMQVFVIPRLDGIVSVTDAIIQAFAPKRHFLRMEGGIAEESKHFGPIETKSSEHEKQIFTIVSAGSLDEPNGVLEILRGFAMITRRDVRLIFAGLGPLADEIRSAVASDERISYIGFVPYEEVLRRYQTADLLINMRLTRKVDTKFFFPSKIMEYLASGTPVISTCTGHVEQEFGEFCFLLKEETPQALASLIQHVMSLPGKERQKIGQKARAYMLQNKTWDVQGQQVVHYISERVL